ncbi:MAG: 4-alpha-glucanotransferase [Bacillota bacterium]
MKLIKGSGVLLHPTSLPGIYGIGDLGPEAYKFVDFLANSKQKYWQILPLNPPGYGESPYQAFSAFAGNPLLISPDNLIQEGLLEGKEIENIPHFNKEQVEFEKVKSFKDNLFRKAFKRFKSNESTMYQDFLKDNVLWLENYSLFMALKAYYGGSSWNKWERMLVHRDEAALNYYKKLLGNDIEYHKFLQYKFFSQWQHLKEYCNSKGIQIIGDIPIFVSLDSADVWANPYLFSLDEEQNPIKVAGVPPDYFSETGQLWGNPHYDWIRMEEDGYQWWRQRFSNILSMADIVRVDHFRGFEAYWAIPFGEETAVNGKWVKGPGEKFFSTLEKNLGKLPVIAEDLGIITVEVEQLKNKFGFPGMKILQFILEDTTQEVTLPLNFEINSVVYTGTHDNDTIWGWYKKNYLKENLEQISNNMNGEKICWHFIEIAFQSSSVLAIIPLQDILCLDSSARMNYPGTLGNNWNWRFKRGDLSKDIEMKLEHLVKVYKR